jgi:hypothetical protein
MVQNGSMRSEELSDLSDCAVQAVLEVQEEDWSRPAFGLEWTCWQTVDHLIDCLFSYTFQVAARAQSVFLPFNELHAQSGATPEDLGAGLRGILVALQAVLDAAPEGTTASDGVLALEVSDWRARAAYELVLHTYDVVSAFQRDYSVSDELSRSLIECDTLWMMDHEVARTNADPWTGLLSGSGREPLLR